MVVRPFGALGKNAGVADGIFQIGRHLVHLVGSAELQFVQRSAITNHNLTRVLVRHHNSGHRQLRPFCVRVVSS